MNLQENIDKEKVREKREQQREHYKPKSPKTVERLFIALAPPKDYTNRFFYYEDYVTNGDYLYVEILTAVLKYDDFTPNEEALRHHKKKYLTEFKNRGFFLIDSTEYPIDRKGKSYKRNRIRQGIEGEKGGKDLKQKIRGLIPNGHSVNTLSIILITAPVYDILYDELKNDFNVINERINFPVQPHTEQFRDAIDRALKKSGYPTKIL